MNVHRSIESLRAELVEVRRSGRSIAFVPTMGALHEGHLSLVRAARAECDFLVVSIFVNPLQFAPTDDLARYPRTTESDLASAREESVDAVFLPEVDEMYPEGAATLVSPGPLADVAEGASRPGHFAGVATVVVKLFNIVQPDLAFFGQKDAQQVAVIKQIVRDLSIPVEIRVCPTVRDPKGLALSSRNAYLDEAEMRAAAGLWRALEAGRAALEEGPADVAEKVMRTVIEDAGLELDYALVVDPDTFERAGTEGARLLIVAAQAGSTRLIDNVVVD